MRILTVCRDLGLGGTQRVACNFSLAYRRAGHDVVVLAWGGDGPRRRSLEAAGITVVCGGHDPMEAVALADAFCPDIIHIHRAGMRNDAETGLLGRLRRADRRVLETNVFARVDRSEAADLIDVHFQLSAWCMWRWRRWLGAERNRHAGVVVPNAIETADFRRALIEETVAFRMENNIPFEAYLCGRVGQPAAANWHPQIIRSFAVLAQRDPHAHLVLVGLPQTLLAEVRSLPPDIRRRVRLLEMTDCDRRLSVIYSALDCFIHAAHSGESFGLVLAEAMLCGCPVVTASRPHKSNTPLELVGHRRGGLVAGSVKRLPQAVMELWSDGELRRSISASARTWVESRFASDTVAAVALRVADMALGCGDRRRLIALLESCGDLKTDTSDAEIRALLENTLGGPDPLEMLAMRVVHNPLVQRAISAYLGWRYGRGPRVTPPSGACTA